MSIGTLLLFLAGAFLLFAAGACGYYLFLAIVAEGKRIRNGRPDPIGWPPDGFRHRFAILIPAHNEEDQLAAVLESCAAFAYPRELYQVYVIADNCTDATADVAGRQGAACFVRNDPAHPGKGPALAWALAQILPDKPDAVVVLDADCFLDAHALAWFDALLSAGHRVLQAAYVASNPDDGVVAYVGSVANLIENDFFYAPKSDLGLAVLLRGTGMVFRRDVLERWPWDATSVVEDTEYTIRLLRSGVPVRFVPEVKVRSAFPSQPAQMQVQRTRWIGGNARLAMRQTWPLFLDGLRQRRLDLIDLAWTLVVAGRSLIVLELLLTLLLTLVDWEVLPGKVPREMLAAAIGLVALHAGYFALGAWRLGLTNRRLRLLVRAPATVLRLLLIAMTSLLPGRNRNWERTPR